MEEGGGEYRPLLLFLCQHKGYPLPLTISTASERTSWRGEHCVIGLHYAGLLPVLVHFLKPGISFFQFADSAGRNAGEIDFHSPFRRRSRPDKDRV